MFTLLSDQEPPKAHVHRRHNRCSSGRHLNAVEVRRREKQRNRLRRNIYEVQNSEVKCHEFSAEDIHAEVIRLALDDGRAEIEEFDVEIRRFNGHGWAPFLQL